MPADLVPQGDSSRLRYLLDLSFSRYRMRYPCRPPGTSVQGNSDPVRLLVVNCTLQISGRPFVDANTMARMRPRQRVTGGNYMFDTDLNTGADLVCREMTVR